MRYNGDRVHIESCNGLHTRIRLKIILSKEEYDKLKLQARQEKKKVGDFIFLRAINNLVSSPEGRDE